MYDVTRLHTAMVNQGFSVFSLSKKANMPEATVRQIFQRKSGRAENIKKIADALGIELKDIAIRVTA